jgi:hypothetical protein
MVREKIGPGTKPDPVWEDRIEYSAGCKICEIPARMWEVRKGKSGLTLELRFHNKCLAEILSRDADARGRRAHH